MLDLDINFDRSVEAALGCVLPGKVTPQKQYPWPAGVTQICQP